MTNIQDERDSELREQAIRTLKKRHDFHGHLLVYVLVNTVVVVIWAMTTPDHFFWPIFSIAGWGIGVVMNAWDVYATHEADDARIEREMRRLQRRR